MHPKFKVGGHSDGSAIPVLSFTVADDLLGGFLERRVRAWEEKFGSGGVLHEVRWIRIDPDLEDDPEREPQESRRLREAALKQAQELAAELRERIEDGEDFGVLARRHSVASITSAEGGLLSGVFDLRQQAKAVDHFHL